MIVFGVVLVCYGVCFGGFVVVFCFVAVVAVCWCLTGCYFCLLLG